MGPEQPQNQLIPPSMGYGQVADTSWNMQTGFAPWVGGYMQQPGMPMHPNCMQPGMLDSSPYLMSPPTDQANQILEGLTTSSPSQGGKSGVDMSPVSLTGSDAMGFSLDPSEMTCMLSLPPDLSGSLHIPGMSPWPASDEEEFYSRTYNRYSQKGLRTPSSLGSPPLSEPPTEAPSPRLGHVEADSNHSCQDASSEDASREPAHVLNMMTMKSKELAYSSETGAATIESVSEPLALQNIFLEAPPVPPSPSRAF
jgi:hypothetical protein